MPRDLILDFRQGGGSVPEVPFGIVRIWGTEVRPNATSLVLTTETTLKLTGGKATLLNAQTGGTGPLYEWAYIVQVEPFHGRNYRFYVGIPDGTTPVNLKDLPKLNPNTGEGFYVDIEEWEALYGDLPNRVAATETKNTSQDTKITALEARPSGNATMRVDTTVGTRVFLNDGSGERRVSGDTGWRNVSSLLANGWTGTVHARRVNDTVDFRFEGLNASAATSGSALSLSTSTGLRPAAGVLNGRGLLHTTSLTMRRYSISGAMVITSYAPSDVLYGQFTATAYDPWPAALPGTAV